MTMGRPTEYKPVNKNLGDEVLLSEITTNPWVSESYLNKQLLKNIDDFMERAFSEKVKSATDKKSKFVGAARLKTGQLLPLRGPRLDLWVECESGNNYLIEIKNPKKSNYEGFRALGQILGYSHYFPEATHLVLVSTAYDQGLHEVLEKYNLPIIYILITETQAFTLKRGKYGKV